MNPIKTQRALNRNLKMIPATRAPASKSQFGEPGTPYPPCEGDARALAAGRMKRPEETSKWSIATTTCWVALPQDHR